MRPPPHRHGPCSDRAAAIPQFRNSAIGGLIPFPYELHRFEIQILAGEFRRGTLSEPGFRHHLRRLRFNPSEIEAEVAHHRTEMSVGDREAA